MMQNKTPNKRKSFGGKNAENSPAVTQKTPKQDKMKTPKKSPAPQSPEKQNQQQGNKRKSLVPPVAAQNGDSSPPKKQKMQPFAGTGAMPSPAKEKPAQNGAEPKEQRAKRRRDRMKGRPASQQTKVLETVDKLKSGDAEAMKKIQDKIDEYNKQKATGTLTKTAQRKLRKLKGLLQKAGLAPPSTGNEQPKKEGKKQAKKAAAILKKAQPPKKVEEEDDDDDESDYDAESLIKPDKIAKNMNDDSEDDEEDDDDEDDDESGEEEEESDDEEAPKAVNPKKQADKVNTSVQKGKTRYVVFVGNLPYDVTKDEITAHFKSVGEIRDVRIPTDPKSNKPRGFAYVEVNDEQSYQKALSLHNTFVKGRKVNVMYTQGGKKKGEDAKKEIKSKNFKLQAMRKKGQLAGGVNESQKRSQRRGKQAAN